jgi:hypothetical protein
MVKTVSELESRVKNYHEKNEKWWVCMHACVRWQGREGGKLFLSGKWVTWVVDRKVRGG